MTSHQYAPAFTTLIIFVMCFNFPKDAKLFCENILILRNKNDTQSLKVLLK